MRMRIGGVLSVGKVDLGMHWLSMLCLDLKCVCGSHHRLDCNLNWFSIDGCFFLLGSR